MLRVKEVGYDFFSFSLSLVLSISQLESIPFPSPSQLSPAQPSPAQLSPVQSSPNHPGLPVRQPGKLTDRPSESKIPYVSSFPILTLSLSHTLQPPSLPSVIDGKKRKKGKQKEKTKKKLSQHHAAVFSHFIDVDDDDPLPLPIVVSVSVSPL